MHEKLLVLKSNVNQSNTQNWIHMKYKDYKIKYYLCEIH